MTALRLLNNEIEKERRLAAQEIKEVIKLLTSDYAILVL